MKSLLLAATALSLLCGTAFAQTPISPPGGGSHFNRGAGSNSSSAANSRSSANTRSTATSGVIVNNYDGTTGTGTLTSTADTGTTTTGTTSAGTASTGGTTATGASNNSTSTQTLRNTPELVTPSIVGGNPCTVGISTGLALPGFGIVGGGSWEGKGCERRQLAALLYNMGHDLPAAKGTTLQMAAVEVLCSDADVRSALKRVGQPCIVDRPIAAAAVAPVGFAAPAPAIAAPVAGATASRATIAAPAPIVAPTAARASAPAVANSPAAQSQRPEWCYTASLAELRAYPVCAAKS